MNEKIEIISRKVETIQNNLDGNFRTEKMTSEIIWFMGLVTETTEKKKICDLEDRSIEIMQYFVFVNIHFFNWEKMNSISAYHGTTSTS